MLNIPTKINKGSVEIITPVELIKKGDKVGSSEAALLSKLNIRPFSYGLVVVSVYDNGSVFSPEVLDLSEDDLVEKFAAGINMVAAMSLSISYPTLAAAPHMFIDAFKDVLSVAVTTDYSFPQAETVKEYLKVYSRTKIVVWDSANCFLINAVVQKLVIEHSWNKKNMQDPSRFAVASAPVAVASEVKAEDERQEQCEEGDDEEDEAMIFNLFE